MLPIEYITRGMAQPWITLVAHPQAHLSQPKPILPVCLALEIARLTIEITTLVTATHSQSLQLSMTIIQQSPTCEASHSLKRHKSGLHIYSMTGDALASDGACLRLLAWITKPRATG